VLVVIATVVAAVVVGLGRRDGTQVWNGEVSSRFFDRSLAAVDVD
jgi:hypothetical protein